MIGLEHYLAVAAALFVIGVFGLFLNRKNVIIMLMSIELMLLGQHAAALEPIVPDMPDCALEQTVEAGLAGYFVSVLNSGFVSYRTLRPDGVGAVAILEHCPSQTQLLLDLPNSGDPVAEAAVLAIFDDMIFGEMPYTQAEIASRSRGVGGFVEVSDVNHESCACT